MVGGDAGDLGAEGRVFVIRHSVEDFFEEERSALWDSLIHRNCFVICDYVTDFVCDTNGEFCNFKHVSIYRNLFIRARDRVS